MVQVRIPSSRMSVLQTYLVDVQRLAKMRRLLSHLFEIGGEEWALWGDC